MKRVGLSQEQVSFTAELHRTEVGLLERGGRLPRIDTLVKLASALGIFPGNLLNGITWDAAQVASGGSGVTPSVPEPARALRCPPLQADA